MWTLLLLTTALGQTPDAAEEAGEPPARDLTFTIELTGGSKQLGVSTFVDYGVLPDVLYLNAGYSLLRPPALPATDTSPALPTAATHVFFAGADWSIGRHFTLSGLINGSPKATDTVVLNPNAPAILKVSVATFRSSFGGSLMAAWNSAGLSRVEWVFDAGASVTSNRIGRDVHLGLQATHEVDDPLISARALVGATVTLFANTDISVRGGYTGYSSDPLQAGKFDADQRAEIQRVVSSSNAGRFTTDLEALARAAELFTSQLARADALSGYASAPIWLEAKVQVIQRFGERWSCQLGWAWNRYVPTAGHANIINTRVTVKLGGSWRLWLGGALQFDEPLDDPGKRTSSDPQRSTSGLATIGAELTI
jgi:hypothetical protein